MLLNMLSLTGVLYIIAMTIDRFISVRFPLKAAYYCTASRAKKIITVITVVVFFYSIPHFLYAQSVGPTCIGMDGDSAFTSIFSWMTVSLNSFVPFVVLIILNIGIIHSLIQFRNSLNIDLKAGQTVDSQKVQDVQMITTLLLISFGFLTLTMPLHARYLYYRYVDYLSNLKSLSDFYLAYHFTSKLFYTNSAVNFLFYNVGGSKFRKDLSDLLRSICCGKQPKSSNKKGTTISMSTTI